MIDTRASGPRHDLHSSWSGCG